MKNLLAAVVLTASFAAVAQGKGSVEATATAPAAAEKKVETAAPATEKKAEKAPAAKKVEAQKVETAAETR